MENKPTLALVAAVALALALLAGCSGLFGGGQGGTTGGGTTGAGTAESAAPPPEPDLSIEGVTGHDEWSLNPSTGCYSTVSGYVKNSGTGKAEDVRVTCSTSQDGSLMYTNSKNIGSVNPDSMVPFSMDVDTDCLKGSVSYDCTIQ